MDARKEILPSIIKANDVQVGEGVAWDLIQAFLKECAARAAATGEMVTVGSLNTSSGAAVNVTLTDGTVLYHTVAFG